VENFAASLSRTIAEQRGRNVEWAEKAVRKSVSATEREAVKLKVVDFVATDVADVLAQGEAVAPSTSPGSRRAGAGRCAGRADRHAPRQKIFDFLANPNLAYLLLMAGLLGLYVEFTNPGPVVPGVAGVICLSSAWRRCRCCRSTTPASRCSSSASAMLVAEAFLPSFGVVGVGGIVAFVLGSLLLFDTPDDALRVDRGLIAGRP
jgi:membrane-bound serine protease (ClpP class)